MPDDDWLDEGGLWRLRRKLAIDFLILNEEWNEVTYSLVYWVVPVLYFVPTTVLFIYLGLFLLERERETFFRRILSLFYSNYFLYFNWGNVSVITVPVPLSPLMAYDILGEARLLLLHLPLELWTQVLCTKTKEVGWQQAGFSPFTLSPPFSVCGTLEAGRTPLRTHLPASRSLPDLWLGSINSLFFFFSLISSEKKCQGTVRVQFFPGFCFSFFLSFFLSIFLLLLLLLYISFHSKER